jgi:cytochrome c oxidase subunit IV
MGIQSKDFTFQFVIVVWDLLDILSTLKQHWDHVELMPSTTFNLLTIHTMTMMGMTMVG